MVFDPIDFAYAVIANRLVFLPPGLSNRNSALISSRHAAAWMARRSML